MTSDAAYNEAYVWIWLPGETAPVVAGRLSRHNGQLLFNYGRSYLQRDNAIALYSPELPLQQGILSPLPGLSMASCIRDASPDAWGRRVLINHKLGLRGSVANGAEPDELTCLLESGSDRIGALDFQHSPTEYVPRQERAASLSELMQAVEKVEQGIPLHPDLDVALQHGTSIGGARPKALLEEGERKYIAKFSSANDLHNIVKAEFIAMRLAAEVGLDVAPVKLTRALGKDVLLIERFDRVHVAQGWQRKAMVSALTLFELDEMMAAYASYETLAEIIRHRFTNPTATLRELFGRLTFNVLCGNTDDHARNHAAFWDGQALTLTKAYDICPQSRTGFEATQAMLIHGSNRMSQLTTCLDAAPAFLLNQDDAKAIIAHQINVIRERFQSVCDEAELAAVDRQLLWRRQFLNPFAFYGAPEGLDGPD